MVQQELLVLEPGSRVLSLWLEQNCRHHSMLELSIVYHTHHRTWVGLPLHFDCVCLRMIIVWLEQESWRGMKREFCSFFPSSYSWHMIDDNPLGIGNCQECNPGTLFHKEVSCVNLPGYNMKCLVFLMLTSFVLLMKIRRLHPDVSLVFEWSQGIWRERLSHREQPACTSHMIQTIHPVLYNRVRQKRSDCLIPDDENSSCSYLSASNGNTCTLTLDTWWCWTDCCNPAPLKQKVWRIVPFGWHTIWSIDSHEEYI